MADFCKVFQEKLYLSHPIRWGMVGGGRGSEIGYPHRVAARRDCAFVLCCGAFDIDPEKGKEFGQSIGISPSRCYKDYLELIECETKREDGMQALTIATPNKTHYTIAKTALENGLHVICEKPLTLCVEEARALKRIAEEKELILGVGFGYSGYNTVEIARQMVARGEIGELRIVRMQFAFGHFYKQVERVATRGSWRFSSKEMGSSYVIADIGTHCYHLGRLISGLELSSLSCVRQSFVASRSPLEDNAFVTLKYKGGAVGTLWASGVNVGSAHGQRVHVIGSKGSIEWWDEYPNQLKVAIGDEPLFELQSGNSHHENGCTQINRVGCGHPEGFFDAWSNLYLRFGLAISGTAHQHPEVPSWYPNVDDGIEAVRFVERAVDSANHDGKWVYF